MVLATIRRHDRRFLPGLSSPPSPAASPSFFNDAALPSAPSRPLSSPLLFPPPFLSSSERRQVGVRAAVNSPAPLSTLMSLLLFALLNAIRAYSVSLPRGFSDPALPRRPFDFPAETWWFTHGRADIHTHTRARFSILAATLSRADPATGTRSHEHARNTRTRTDRRARNARYRAEGTAGA